MSEGLKNCCVVIGAVLIVMGLIGLVLSLILAINPPEPRAPQPWILLPYAVFLIAFAGMLLCKAGEREVN